MDVVSSWLGGVSAKHTYGSSALLDSWVQIAKIGAQEDCSWVRGS